MQGMIDSVKNNIGSAVAQAYHTVYYVNGTDCDITQKPRTAQVDVSVKIKIILLSDRLEL